MDFILWPKPERAETPSDFEQDMNGFRLPKFTAEVTDEPVALRPDLVFSITLHRPQRAFPVQRRETSIPALPIPLLRLSRNGLPRWKAQKLVWPLLPGCQRFFPV